VLAHCSDNNGVSHSVAELCSGVGVSCVMTLAPAGPDMSKNDGGRGAGHTRQWLGCGEILIA